MVLPEKFSAAYGTNLGGRPSYIHIQRFAIKNVVKCENVKGVPKVLPLRDAKKPLVIEEISPTFSVMGC